LGLTVRFFPIGLNKAEEWPKAGNDLKDEEEEIAI
jgi:hypothetical protein